MMAPLRPRLIRKVEFKGESIVKGRQLEGLRKIAEWQAFTQSQGELEVDEIIIQDVGSSVFGLENGLAKASELIEKTSSPVTFGGGIRSLTQAKMAFDTGVERILLNSSLHHNPKIIEGIVSTFGSQAVVASVETRKIRDEWRVFYDYGRELSPHSLKRWSSNLSDMGVGEILIVSISSDGLLKGADWDLCQEIASLGLPRWLYGGGVSSFTEALELTAFDGLRGVVINRLFQEDQKTLAFSRSSWCDYFYQKGY